MWYSWEDWEAFIDWMALSGINHFLGMTGQEEVQYKVFRQFGLNDTTIRGWFNGPALLAWSRGQNEYGSHIGGPLPRSWMKQQWTLQQQILGRSRALGMSSQLPGFQGNVPVELPLPAGSNLTKAGATGWLSSTDPMYGKIADVWMQTLIADFGTDHLYQLDGYFDGGTAPWLAPQQPPQQPQQPAQQDAPAGQDTGAGVACTWSGLTPNTYATGCPPGGCRGFDSAAAAKVACAQDEGCAAVTEGGAGVPVGRWQVRKGTTLQKSPAAHPSSSYRITNLNACHHPGPPPPPPPRPPPSPPPLPVVDDPVWFAHGVAAYTGLNRTDPEAVWSYQGWAFVGFDSDKQRNQLKGFIDAAPKGKFSFTDMRAPWRDAGRPEWMKFENGTGLWGHGDKGQFIK